MIARHFAAMFLVVNLATQSLGLAQQQPPGAERAAGPRRLRIIVLEGEGAVNHIPTHTATAPVVEIHDENDQPVEGASVVFQLPPTGPGGVFQGSLPSQTAVSDTRGQAGARGYLINDQPGPFTIRVTATFQSLSATALINQANSIKLQAESEARGKSHRKWMWILIAAGATAAAGTAVYLGTRDNTPAVSASTGSVVIGAPR